MPDSNATLAPLFSWRSAICESNLHPTTRHVLLALSLYMNQRGGSAFPGTARLAHDTGYHADTVKDHLRRARDTGWIRVLHQGGSIPGGKRLANEYAASVPGVVDPQSERTGGRERSDRGSCAPGPGVVDPPHLYKNSSENSPAVSRISDLPKTKPPWVEAGMSRDDWMHAALEDVPPVVDTGPRGKGN